MPSKCPHYLAYMNLLKKDDQGRFVVICDNCMGWWRTTAGYGAIIPKITSAKKRDGTPLTIEDLMKPEKELPGDD